MPNSDAQQLTPLRYIGAQLSMGGVPGSLDGRFKGTELERE